jgi:hypothetical protein
MLDALLVFLVWVRFIPGRGPAAPPPADREAAAGAG